MQAQSTLDLAQVIEYGNNVGSLMLHFKHHIGDYFFLNQARHFAWNHLKRRLLIKSFLNFNYKINLKSKHLLRKIF